MVKIFEIIKKNIKLLVRSKSSALIVLLGPLALMLLIGLAFNTSSLFDIKIGTYSSGYSELSNSIIEKLQDEQFKVIRINSEERCTEMIKTGDLHVCTIFPKDLSLKTNDKIVFYVDKSRINFVYIILDRISTKIATKSTELSTALTNRLLTSLNNANSKLSEKQATLTSLSASLSDSKTTVTKVINDFSDLDLTAEGSNFSEVKSEISELEAKDNSTSKYAELNDLIGLIELNYNSISAKMNLVNEFRDLTKKGLDDIKTKLSGNIQSSKNIEDTIKEINQDINSIEIRDVARIVSPVTTEIKPVSADSTNLNYTFPTLVVLVLLFAGLLLASTMVVQEKESKAYFRNFITPTKDITFILGNYLSSIIIIILQLVIIFMVMFGVSNTSISDITLLNAFIVLILLGSVFILLGMLIGYMFKSGETSNIAAISLASILLFFSNTILPIETLPSSIRGIVQFNPYIIGESALRKILLFDQGLSTVLSQIYVLIGYMALLLIIVYLFREFTKKWFSG